MKIVRPRPEEGQEIDPPSRRRARSTARGRLARAPKPSHPAVYLEAAALLEHRPLIRSTLRARGVRAADLDDVTQETVLGAWRSMGAGRFRPSPDQPPHDALRAWLAAVASRQASHHREKAYRRHEVPAVEPHRLAALDMAALTFVLAHNHPSGDPAPTEVDHAMTQELRELSYALNVPLQAHVIVTPGGRYAAVLE